jgi:hypothetical protein
LAATGQPLNDLFINSFFLADLGFEYDPLVTSIITRIYTMNIDDIFGHMLAYKMPLTQHQPSSDFLMSSTNLTARFPGRGRRGRFSFLGHGDQLDSHGQSSHGRGHVCSSQGRGHGNYFSWGSRVSANYATRTTILQSIATTVSTMPSNRNKMPHLGLYIPLQILSQVRISIRTLVQPIISPMM